MGTQVWGASILGGLLMVPVTMLIIAAGASHIGFRDFLFGTVACMLPDTLAFTLLASSLYDD